MKSSCTVGIEWAPDGKHVLSAVLYERVKVDNEVRIYDPIGNLLCNQSFVTSELYDVQWQPYPKGSLPKPELSKLVQQKKTVEEAKKGQDDKPKPKKWFNPSSGDNTFAQIMR